MTEQGQATARDAARPLQTALESLDALVPKRILGTFRARNRAADRVGNSSVLAGDMFLIMDIPWDDAELIASSVELAPRMSEGIQSVLKLHRPMPRRFYGTDGNAGRHFYCHECGVSESYPCRTIKALEGIVPSTEGYPSV